MQTYSARSLDGSKELTWEVENLIEISKGCPQVRWEIPAQFSDSYSWGDEHISEHLAGCLDADVSKPILIWNGEIVDGCHRVCKALSLGHTHIQALDLSFRMPYPDRVEEAGESKEPTWCFGDMVQIMKAIRQREYDYCHPLDV